MQTPLLPLGSFNEKPREKRLVEDGDGINGIGESGGRENVSQVFSVGNDARSVLASITELGGTSGIHESVVSDTVVASPKDVRKQVSAKRSSA